MVQTEKSGNNKIQMNTSLVLVFSWDLSSKEKYLESLESKGLIQMNLTIQGIHNPPTTKYKQKKMYFCYLLPERCLTLSFFIFLYIPQKEELLYLLFQLCC